MDQHLISLWILVGMATVCSCQATAAIVQPFKNQYELVGSSATLTTVIQKSSKTDLVVISHSLSGDIWKEGTGYIAGYPTQVSVSTAVDLTTHLGVYNVTVDLPNNTAILTKLCVDYKARLLSNALVTTKGRVHALDPVSCDTTGASIKLPDEQVNVTCSTHYYGMTTPVFDWQNLWFQLKHSRTISHVDTDRVGYIYTTINRYVKEEDNGKAFQCEMSMFGLTDTCQVKYSVLSCNTSTRCIVTPFRNSAGKMGDSVTLSSTFRKESSSDMVVITYDPPQAPGTVIWEEGTNVIPPTGISVNYSVDPTSLLAVYNVTIQLPAYNDSMQYDNDLINLTVAYSAYMTSQPIVKTSAKVAAVDDVTCRVWTKPQYILYGLQVLMSCKTAYYGYKMPSLDWYTQSGSSIRSSARSYTSRRGPMEVDIRPTVFTFDDRRNFQCKLSYNKDDFDFFPPQYQDTCNVSLSVLYGAKCSLVGSTNKQPGQPILMTCTTKYDGVNLPELDWYAPGDKNITTGRTVNNETNEYKVTFLGTAGNTDKTYQCQLKHKYTVSPNTTQDLSSECFTSYTVERSVSMATALFPSVWKVIVMVSFVVLQPW